MTESVLNAQLMELGQLAIAANERLGLVLRKLLQFGI